MYGTKKRATPEAIMKSLLNKLRQDIVGFVGEHPFVGKSQPMNVVGLPSDPTKASSDSPRQSATHQKIAGVLQNRLANGQRDRADGQTI
jgi:hypothetical protein